MSESTSVLGHLALRLASHPENIATEALNFILHRSDAAREAMTRIANELGAKTEGALTFSAQVTSESGARPDLVGYGEDQSPRLLIEVKFWAGLTDHQPVGYLRSMDAWSAGCLLFVAPEKRLESLWPEVKRLAIGSGYAVGPDLTVGKIGNSVSVAHHVMAMVSWRALIERLLDAVVGTGDAGCADDLRQLGGLTAQMDSSAFLPLHADDLNENIGRRIVQFGELVDTLTERLVADDLGDVRRLRQTAGNGTYGRYLLLKGYAGFLHVSSPLWTKYGRTPLWMSIMEPGWKPATAATQASLHAAGVPFHRVDRWCSVPLLLSTRVERAAVIYDAYRQLLAVANALPDMRGLLARGNPDEFTTEPPETPPA